MPVVPTSDHSHVLHVAAQNARSEWTEAGDSQTPLSRLHESGLGIRICRDAYRALALLCRQANDAASSGWKISAVVIDVDGLDEQEMQFFKCAGALRKGPTVFAYSGSGDIAKVDSAIHFGATARFDEQAIRRLTTDLCEVPAADFPETTSEIPMAPDDLETPQQAPNEVELDPLQSQGISTLAETVSPVEFDEVVDDDGDEAIDSTEDSTLPARVPWKQYRAQPGRIAPGQASPSNSDSTEKPIEQESPTNENSEGPLLTNAEMQALIGDDISALTPSQSFEDRTDTQGAEEPLA